MTRNLDVKTMPSYCYEAAEQNCRRYGRLYTWESAPRACLSLGDGWRLPTDNEWRQMAKAYGGVSEDSEDKGKAAYKRSWPEAARDFMRCSAAAAPRTASMRDWKPTDSIGLHRRSIRRTDGTTTSVKAGWLSTVKTVVRSRELFPFGASESDDCMLCSASSE